MSEHVKYQLNEGVATIAMDDGKVNAMSLNMIATLNRMIDRAEADRAAIALVGRSGVFSAGFDLATLGAKNADSRSMVKAGFELAERMLSFPRPIVIACTGHAIAMGVFLVLCADYRIGADGAFKLGPNEVAIGLTMPYFAIEICRQRLAPAHFHRALINAEPYSPSAAVAAGFLDQVIPAEGLLSVAQGVATQLAKLDAVAFRETKLRVRAQALAAIRDAIEKDDAVSEERSRRV